MSRKKLTEIKELFEETPPQSLSIPQPAEPKLEDNDSLPSSSATTLTTSLSQPKKKPTKIRFTLDLEKPLDDRLNRAANKLNRSKADLTRIALERLLEHLEKEW